MSAFSKFLKGLALAGYPQKLGAAAPALLAAETPAVQREALGVNRSPMSGRIMGVIAHSFGARGWTFDGGYGYSTQPTAPMIWALNKLGWPVVTPWDYVMVASGKKLLGDLAAGSGGVSATNLALQMVAKNPKPDWVFFDCAINDVGDFTSGGLADGAGMFARWRTPIDTLLAAGIKVIVALMTPTSQHNTDYLRRVVMTANQLMRDAYRAEPNVVIWDYYWTCLDQTATTSTTMLSTWTADTLHLNCVASAYLGQNSLYNLLKNIYPFNSPIDWLVQHPLDVYAADNRYGNRLSNGLLAGTGGTKTGTAPPTGVVADNWQMNHFAGDGACVCSKETYNITLPDGTTTGQTGEWQVFTLTGGTVADEWWFRNNTTNRGPNGPSGELGYYVACEVAVAAGSSGLTEVCFHNNCASGNGDVYAFSNPYPTLALPAFEWQGTLRSIDNKLQHTGAQTIVDHLRIKVAAGGSAVVKVRRMTDRTSAPGTLLPGGVVVP